MQLERKEQGKRGTGNLNGYSGGHVNQKEALGGKGNQATNL